MAGDGEHDVGVFNLLPGTPLDGGRVLHGLLWRHTRDRARATRSAAGAGQVLGALVAGLGAVLVFDGRLDGLWLVLVGWFLAGTAASEREHGVMTERLAGLVASDVMRREPYLTAERARVAAAVGSDGSTPAVHFEVGAVDGERSRRFYRMSAPGREAPLPTVPPARLIHIA